MLRARASTTPDMLLGVNMETPAPSIYHGNRSTRHVNTATRRHQHAGARTAYDAQTAPAKHLMRLSHRKHAMVSPLEVQSVSLVHEHVRQVSTDIKSQPCPVATRVSMTTRGRLPGLSIVADPYRRPCVGARRLDVCIPIRYRSLSSLSLLAATCRQVTAPAPTTARRFTCNFRWTMSVGVGALVAISGGRVNAARRFLIYSII